jgi:hypothetical protein
MDAPSGQRFAVTSDEDFTFVQSLLELKFPRAHRYWDESGQLIETIEQRIPGLKCEKLEDNGFRFSGVPAGVAHALFYWDSVIAIQDASSPASKFV